VFPNGHELIVEANYVKHISQILGKSTHNALGYLADEEIVVLSSGRDEYTNLFFIQVLSKNTHAHGYNNGCGVTLFFKKEEHLLNSFVDLTAKRNVVPKIYHGFNNTPRIIIPAYHLVKIGYYSRTIAAHLIEIATVDDTNSDLILGITEERIAPGLFGKVTQVF